ncbi:MAG: vitamin K epoxide reductase family protein [Chloroflexi bacterium]|nr:vitamin K epoxide reductase family protein [Chloroflexota bacterium]
MTSVPKTQATTQSAAEPRDWLHTLSLLLVVVGIVISGYLSYTKLTNVSVICAEGESFNCDAVTSSVYGKVAGIPVAYLGLAAYLFIGALLLLERRVTFVQEYGIMLLFGVTLFGFIYSMFLVYVQAAILKSFCVWCLGHEVVMTLLFVLSSLRLYRSLKV